MKIKSFFKSAAIALTSLIMVSCNESITSTEDLNFNNEKSAFNTAMQGDSCNYDGIISEEEEEGLLFMIEEEKLAHDVYLKFGELFDYAVFKNISKSEEMHVNALKSLLSGYNIDFQLYTEAGLFYDPAFNKLYDNLISDGSGSLIGALRTGALIEELDISDILEQLKNTVNSDVIRVYSNLLNGSENHLRAFVKALNNMDESYIPSVLSADQYQEIMEGENNSKGKNKRGGSSSTCDGTGNGTQQHGNQQRGSKGNGNSNGAGNYIGNNTNSGQQGNNYGNGNRN